MWGKLRDLLTQAQEAVGVDVPELPDVGAAAEATTDAVTTAGEHASDIAGSVSGSVSDSTEKASGLVESLKNLLGG